MNRTFPIVFITAILTVITSAGLVPTLALEPVRPEVRAIWVDAFHDGIKTPGQIDKLIQDTVKANINTLIVQVRRRGDAYYNNSIEPRTEDPDLLSGFDSLQYLIAKAHANRIEVHAWLNTLVAWYSSTPPKDPHHVWNLHGPQTTERANWVSYYRTYDTATKSWSEKLTPSYYLDPGHPDLVDYTVAVYLDVVKNYDIDGIHLDYSRYAGLGWGFNATSVARFNARYGTSGLPVPDDSRWSEWRREQTANLVRKVYLKAIALKPNLKVSSAVVTWGAGPFAEGDWERTRAYVDLGQDWRGWLNEKIIDMVIPMNYYSEWHPTQQVWYNQWIEWEKDHQYGRQIVIGPGIFSQYIEQSLEQIRRAQEPSGLGNYAAGVSLYAYGLNNLYSNDDFKDPAGAKSLPRQPHQYLPESNNWLFPLLANKGQYLDPILHTNIVTEPVFPTWAGVPDMPWKSHPRNGYLMGVAPSIAGKSVDHIRVNVEATEYTEFKIHREVYTDGNGWFGLTELPPGVYRVGIEGSDGAGTRAVEVTIRPGQVAETDF